MFGCDVVARCACDAQTEYECGGICRERCEYVAMVKVASVALCEGRHYIPDAHNGFIFPTCVDPTDVRGLEEYAAEQIRESEVRELTVYVTGLTVALVAVINACRRYGVKLTLMHFDRDSGTYYRQEVK